jgi:hypothetical protein
MKTVSSTPATIPVTRFSASEFFGIANLTGLLKELQQGKAAKVMGSLLNANIAVRNEPLVINAEPLRLLKQIIKELVARCDSSITRTRRTCFLKSNPMKLIGEPTGTSGGDPKKGFGTDDEGHNSFAFSPKSAEKAGGSLLTIEYSRKSPNSPWEIGEARLWNNEFRHQGKSKFPAFELKGNGLTIKNAADKVIFSG